VLSLIELARIKWRTAYLDIVASEEGKDVEIIGLVVMGCPVKEFLQVI